MLSGIDRVTIRDRPKGRPLMQQSWGKLLFMHWRIEAALLRPLVPSQLQIDTFDGSAWIAVVPFTMSDTRLRFMPLIPGLSQMHELNVRTYVYFKGTPGVWFFSLDCNSAPVVFGARTLYHLPYYNAEIELAQSENSITYSLQRTEKPSAAFQAVWETGQSLPRFEPGSLEFFLTERYCLYSEHAGNLYQARIHHQPWALQKALVSSCDSSMIEVLGLKKPDGAPLLHYSENLDVEIWPLRKLMASQT